MQVDFYEEYPRECLDKFKLIDFRSKVYLNAESLEKYRELRKKIGNINSKIEPAYWPQVKNSYYISPFFNTKDLKELFNELDKIDDDLLIDIEWPIKKINSSSGLLDSWFKMINKKMIIKNVFSIRKNKRIIKEFLEKNKGRITTAEFPFAFDLFIFRWFGFSYNIDTERSIMLYSSMLPKKICEKIKKNVRKLKNKENYSIGLGTIATGAMSNEPILKSDKLREDLSFVEETGFNKAVIFRVGGLDEKYLEAIREFTN